MSWLEHVRCGDHVVYDVPPTSARVEAETISISGREWSRPGTIFSDGELVNVRVPVGAAPA